MLNIKSKKNSLIIYLLINITKILFVLLFIIFGFFAPRFISWANLENIINNVSYIGIIAVGMTFVLLTGGIDLSVGSTMYFSVAVFGFAVNQLSLPIWAGILLCILSGVLVGCFNVILITRFKVIPFLTTLVSMSIALGLALLITRSKAIDFPESVSLMSTLKVAGFIPLQVFIFLVILVLSTIYLRYTFAGRQVYAVGEDIEAAHKAGINTQYIIAHTYIISGALAAIGGLVSITQIGRANANFGIGEEFNAIAAAILGGASLFGGMGTVFPGTLLGALMIQMIQSGLIFLKVDIYLQPIIQSIIIFLIVFIDSIRITQINKIKRKNIMKIGSVFNNKICLDKEIQGPKAKLLNQ